MAAIIAALGTWALLIFVSMFIAKVMVDRAAPSMFSLIIPMFSTVLLTIFMTRVAIDSLFEKPPSLRFHLSTAMILMFLLSALLYANVVWQPTAPMELKQHGNARAIGQGWPVKFRWRFFERGTEREILDDQPRYEDASNQAVRLSIDATISFVLALGAVIACETRIRRREARQP